MTDTTTLIADAPTTTEGSATQETGTTADTLLSESDQPSSTETVDGASQDDESATSEGEGQKPSDDEPQGAPESYEDFTLPEGAELPAEVADNLKALAKELNLTQEQAQKVADLGVQQSQKWGEQLQSQIDATSDAWASATKADQEIGGDKLAENLGLAKTTLDKFGTPELRELLNTSRLGNNPEVIRLLTRVGKAISDDNRIVTGSAPAVGAKPMADRLYPSQ